MVILIFLVIVVMFFGAFMNIGAEHGFFAGLFSAIFVLGGIIGMFALISRCSPYH